MPQIDPANLSRAMAKSGMSIQQLADELGVSKQYVNDLTKGHRFLKRNAALRKRIAEALDVPIHWIERHEPSDEAA